MLQMFPSNARIVAFLCARNIISLYAITADDNTKKIPTLYYVLCVL